VRQSTEYLATGGPFPERLHLIVLTGKFILDFTALLEDWARWAEVEVAKWPDVDPVDAVPMAWDALREACSRDLIAKT